MLELSFFIWVLTLVIFIGIYSFGDCDSYYFDNFYPFLSSIIFSSSSSWLRYSKLWFKFLLISLGGSSYYSINVGGMVRDYDLGAKANCS